MQLAASDLIAIVALVVSAASYFTTRAIGLRQNNLNSEQIKLGRETGALQDRLSKDEAQAERRRFFSILWDKFILVNYINPAAPIESDVRRAVNTFELIALSWQAGVVDKEMAAIAFGPTYNIICGQIEQVAVVVPGVGKTGLEVLSDHPAIAAVRAEINGFRQQRGSITQP